MPPEITARRVRRAAILARAMPHYRRRLYEIARRLLARRGVELDVWVGELGRSAEGARNDSTRLEGARRMSTRHLRVVGRDVYVHLPPTGSIPDVVVCEHALRNLANFWFLARYLGGRVRFIWWGHGKDFQKPCRGIGDRVKQVAARFASLWFSYNDESSRVLRDETGVTGSRIWPLHNSIDTAAFAREVRAWRQAIGRKRLEEELGAPPASRRLIFCGGIYTEKGLGLLLDAYRELLGRSDGWSLAILGDGPDMPGIRAAARALPGVTVTGFLDGDRKARWFAISDIYVCPGLVGLNVLDAYAAGLPFVTVQSPIHSPEIGYVRASGAGVVADPDPRSLAAAIERASMPAEAAHLVALGDAVAREVTIERMAARFAAGLLATLRRPRRA